MFKIPSTKNVFSKVDQCINAEKIREERNEYIKENGILVGKIRGYNYNKELYCYIH